MIIAFLIFGMLALPITGDARGKTRRTPGIDFDVGAELSNVPVSKLDEVISEEPPLSELYRVALSYAGMDPQLIKTWNKNVKKAVLLPTLQFGYKRGLDDKITVNVDDNISVSSSGVFVGPQSSSWDRYAVESDSFEVRAVWELDKLIFSKEMLNISSEARNLGLDRQEMLDRINHIYHERLRLLAYLAGPNGDELGKNSELHIYLSELAATLDAYTGGWYSRYKEINQ